MGDFLNVAAIAVFTLAALFAFRFIATFLTILRMPFWPVRFTPTLWEPRLAPDQQTAADELERLGFVRVAMDRLEMGPLSCDTFCFRHEGGTAFADITFLSGASNDFMVEFFSFAADGGILLTVNRSGWLLSNCHLDAEVADALAGSLAGHWEYHQARTGAGTLMSLDGKEADRRRLALSESTLPRMIEAKAVVQGRDGTWHYTLRSAWKTVRAMWKVRSKLAKPYRSAVTDGPHRSMLFSRIYEQIETLNAAKPPRRNVTAGVLILTLAVSLALWGNFFDWKFAAILTAVVLVHEGGHALAMRAFGYRDITMFFIPFFGAAVTGTAKEMPVWKQAIVLLAGPVPGLFAAIAFFVYRGFYPFETPYFDFGEAAVVAGMVNLFNLLPLTPLDGGQLLEISVFSRWPRARLAFAALSVLALAALAIWLQDLYLWPIVALLGFTLLTKWRLTELQRAWREGLNPREQLVHLFDVARDTFGPEAFCRHYGLVKAVFNQRKILKPKSWESALALSVMLFVWAPIGLASVELWPRFQTKAATAAKPDLRTKEQREFDKAFRVYDDEGEGAADLASIERLAAKLEGPDPRLNDLAVLKALALPVRERLAQFESLIEQQRAGIVYGPGEVARALLQTVELDNEEKPIGERIASLRASLDRLSAIWPGGHAATVRYRIQLAGTIAESGDAGGAVSALQSLRAALIEAKAESRFLASVIRAEAWFHISREEPEQARRLLKEAMTIMEDMPRQLAVDYAWALLFSGDVKAGAQHMRLAAFSIPPEPTFIDNALGVRAKPKLQRPLDLAYAMMKEKRTEEAAALIAREAPYACRRDPERWLGPWDEARNRALQAAHAAICPEPPKSAAAGK